MRQIKAYILAGALLIGAIAIAALLVSLRPEPPRNDPPPRIPFASTAPAVGSTGAIPVFGSGTVKPRAEVDVAAGVSGRVVWVDPAFKSGGRVREGQALFRVDDAEYRHRAEQARAAVAVQQVELLKVEEEARVAREQFDQFRRRSGNESDPDESPLAQWRPQLEAAQAAVERSRAILAEAELLLSRTEVTAPFDAVVRSEDIAVGRHVAAGMGVGRVFASDAVEIAVPLTDDDAALIPGLWEAGSSGRRIPVRVFADHGDSRYVWEGRVDRVEAVLDESTRTLNVIARIPNPFSGGSPVGEEEASGSPPLLVGQFVDVEITGRASEPYFRIRRLALQPGNQVWVVEGGSVSIVPVRVLQRLDDTALVTGDLVDGQEVIVSGIPFATEGMRVRTESSPD